MPNTMLGSQSFFLADAEATEKLGGLCASVLSEAGVIYLLGELGAGKTTLVRGLLRSLGFEGSTKSPTYTLVEPYLVGGRHIFHFDLYRLADPEELEYIGVDEYFGEQQGLCLIEWPDKGQGWLPEPELIIHLQPKGDGREATLQCFDAQVWSKLEQMS
ncbi:tRNA (adenosine(37)-N6)-threonylcarbamoyltransferase complex ATPase subunit type 1 TsaE [Pleionea sp. CnH1-48]|uniref:tRNA (adenosine(37)-N6)-threonylcarbamoyltransferase complex ATPase subunit type 1 TsaE n=1 Tax=Pleionea sp. CnH1-48 TaxID=2954494 RepID=UPI002097C93D|nr:tRNA (adenosine(37)-N6)-threonylcarbamoyltransferase complex ATPase subunit type 1 TsaE [Pleionea sp. CnH1-48]MCO7224868.1 tRNA (adenosine(37)-N6)-threonylcarbamoyltransferase complex ATPase subunit type 1 TsaE [Pleionea sp. CnH1-48]